MIRVTGLQQALDELSVFKRAQIPFASSWGLNQLGFQLRENERTVMRETFNRLSSFTLNAPLYTKSTKQNLKITFFLRDNAPRGNSPDRYLAPQVTGGEVYVTRFSRALRRLQGPKGSRLLANEYVMHWANPAYPPTPGRITSILASLRGYSGPLKSGAAVKRAASAQGKYFFLGLNTVGDSRGARDRNDVKKRGDSIRARLNGYRGAGIYTTKGKQLELVYRIIESPFRVQPKYEWNEQRIGAFAQERLPGLILEKLKSL